MNQTIFSWHIFCILRNLPLLRSYKYSVFSSKHFEVSLPRRVFDPVVSAVRPSSSDTLSPYAQRRVPVLFPAEGTPWLLAHSAPWQVRCLSMDQGLFPSTLPCCTGLSVYCLLTLPSLRKLYTKSGYLVSLAFSPLLTFKVILFAFTLSFCSLNFSISFWQPIKNTLPLFLIGIALILWTNLGRLHL